MISMATLQARALTARGKRGANHRAWLLAFERVAEQRDRDHRQMVSLMSRTPHDGRPALIGAGHGVQVNAGETRAASRWQSTSRARLLQLWPDMTIEAPERDAKAKRSVKRVSASAERAARLRTAAGTIRMADQD